MELGVTGGHGSNRAQDPGRGCAGAPSQRASRSRTGRLRNTRCQHGKACGARRAVAHCSDRPWAAESAHAGGAWRGVQGLHAPEPRDAAHLPDSGGPGRGRAAAGRPTSLSDGRKAETFWPGAGGSWTAIRFHGLNTTLWFTKPAWNTVTCAARAAWRGRRGGVRVRRPAAVPVFQCAAVRGVQPPRAGAKACQRMEMQRVGAGLAACESQGTAWPVMLAAWRHARGGVWQGPGSPARRPWWQRGYPVMPQVPWGC
jgi:hypothetical protein